MTDSVESNTNTSSGYVPMTPAQRRRLTLGVAICGDGDILRHVEAMLAHDAERRRSTQAAPSSGPFGAW